jgi:UDP-N-acetylglucosamine acyltransferase
MARTRSAPLATMTCATMNIHPTAIIEDGADIGADVRIGPWCRVSAHARLAPGVELKSNVVVEGRTEIGARTVVFPFAALGTPPQHLGDRGEGTRLIIGADCIIRENATLNRGTALGHGETVVGERCFLMVGAHVGHDCVVGSNVIFANNATLGGHVVVEDFVFLGGLCAVHQFCRVGAYSLLAGGAMVTADVIPYALAIGNHAWLGGLNIVGMKRRGSSRAVIHDLRTAYKILFAGEGSFQARLEDVAARYAHREEVQRIVRFIRADARRPLMSPRWRSSQSADDDSTRWAPQSPA